MTPLSAIPLEKPSLPSYAAQRATVRAMFPLLAGLLEAGSEIAEPVRREVASLPEGLVFGRSVFGTDLALRLRVGGSRLVRLDPASAPPPTLELVF